MVDALAAKDGMQHVADDLRRLLPAAPQPPPQPKQRTPEAVLEETARQLRRLKAEKERVEGQVAAARAKLQEALDNAGRVAADIQAAARAHEQAFLDLQWPPAPQAPSQQQQQQPHFTPTAGDGPAPPKKPRGDPAAASGGGAPT